MGAVVLPVLFGPLDLIKHGENLDMKESTSVVAFVSDDTLLPPAAVVAQQAADSSVPDADIEVDGTFVGNTPSTVTVTPGKHCEGSALWRHG